jgi:hypothetical protein
MVMNQSEKDADLVKIKIPLPTGQWHGGEAEWVWAKPLGGGLYTLDNIPAFAPGLALDDVIAAEDEDGVPVFRRVARRGGHSTYWLFFSNDVESPEATNFLGQLESRACSYEGVRGRMIAVDVKPEADIYEVYSLLQKAENEGLLQFEEGHCGHRLRSEGRSGDV